MLKPKYAVYGWEFGDSECEPPEPGKAWLTIAEIDYTGEDPSMGDEVAIVVCRNFEDVKAKTPQVILAKEKMAHRIAAALNFGEEVKQS